MAAESPLNRLVLAATSVADELGFVALADLSRVFKGSSDSYRIIGGHMVTTLVARWQLGAELYRETGDTDLGVPPIVIRDQHLVERLRDLGYEKFEGNRFARSISDVPVKIDGDDQLQRRAIIDVLVGAYTNRPRSNRKIGDLYTTEVPGLPAALKRPAVTMALELHRMDGEVLNAELSFPDEVSALILKSQATLVRSKGTDFVDLWRRLEVGFAAGVSPEDFTDEIALESADIIRRHFSSRAGRGMTAIVAEHRLTATTADGRFTRLRALVERVVGSG